MSRNRLATFSLERAENGSLTARCQISGTLLHSKVSPENEARDIVRSLSLEPCNTVLLVGAGLGYLARALREQLPSKTNLFIIEPDPELFSLASHCDCSYHDSPNTECVVTCSLSKLAAILTSLPGSTRVLIAPYLRRITRNRSDGLSQLLQSLSIELASAQVYNPILREAISNNSAKCATLPSWCEIDLNVDRAVAVIGAGPSLDSCVEVLRTQRDHFTIIAASGACPALTGNQITPDCVIALEALESIVTDIESTRKAVPTVVFPCTNPKVLELCDFCFNGTPKNESSLATHGGTTILPAISLALKRSARKTFLIGVDFGAGPKAYAQRSNRTLSATSQSVSPKFAAMRFQIEAVLSNAHAEAQVYHVSDFATPLRHTTLIRCAELCEVTMSQNAINHSYA